MTLKSIGLYSLIAAATIVGAELLARTYDWSPSGVTGAGDGLGLSRYYHSPAGAGDLVPNQDGHWLIWFHRPYHVQTNSLGLRNTEEPIAGAFQILALGDSQTFGPYLANEDTWPAWTESYLRQRKENTKPVQVFNAGIAGYSILDELALLREKGATLRPSLVLLAVFENDLSDLQKESNGRIQRPSGNAISRLETTLKVAARNSALVNLAERLKSHVQLAAANVDIRRGEGERGFTDAQPVIDEKYVARYSELFRDMAALLKERGTPFAVIYIPAADAAGVRRTSQMESLIRALTSQAGIPYLDLTPAFAADPEAAARFFLLQWDSRQKAYMGNGHLSREGNARIGLEVSRWLAAKNLVPN